MAQWIDLEKKQILEIRGNDMILTISLGNDFGEISVRIESEEGGRLIGIRPHTEDEQVVVFYLKDDGESKPPRFRIV